jgi:hypothetical protein
MQSPSSPYATGKVDHVLSIEASSLGLEGPVCMTIKIAAGTSLGNPARIARRGSKLPSDPPMTMMSLIVSMPYALLDEPFSSKV